MKNTFNGLLADWTWLRKESELENMSTETSQTEIQIEKKINNNNKIQPRTEYPRTA